MKIPPELIEILQQLSELSGVGLEIAQAAAGAEGGAPAEGAPPPPEGGEGGGGEFPPEG